MGSLEFTKSRPQQGPASQASCLVFEAASSDTSGAEQAMVITVADANIASAFEPNPLT